MAEIVRSGVIGVDRGQRLAALALGTPARVMRHIVAAPGMRTIIPPTGNQTISMLKTSSLVSVIALSDLLYTAQSIYGINYQVIRCSWWPVSGTVIVVSVAVGGQGFLERRSGGAADEQRPRAGDGADPGRPRAMAPRKRCVASTSTSTRAKWCA